MASAPEVTPAPAEAPATSKLLPWMIRAGIFVGLGAAAFALVLFVVAPMLPAPGAASTKPVEHAEKIGRVIALDPVVVNLAQSEGRRYLKATVHIEVADEEKAVKEAEGRKPQVLDILVATLSRRSLADVTAPEALDLLRGELSERVGQVLGRERLRRVFITEFVVQ